jgi:tRNA(Arg) A34 adenosine deaminase TadA
VGKHTITATILDKRGRILSQAQNNYRKSHPYQRRIACSVGEPDRIFLHAEIAALIKLKQGTPHKIIVERYLKNGKPANAKPCRVCEEAIKLKGIERVEYTM